MTALDDLTRLLPVPAHLPPLEFDWPAIEHDLGTAVPEDYKRLVETYGLVDFSTTLRVCVPHSPVEALDLGHWIRQTHQLLGNPDFPPEADHVPDGFSLDPATLTAWGLVAGSEYALWYSADPDPNQWPVIVGSNGSWAFYRGTTTEFIHALLTRTLPRDRYLDDISDLIEDNGVYCEIDRDGEKTTIHAG